MIPVSGTAHGANATFFRTELALMNTATTTGSVTVRFRNMSGPLSERTVSVGPKQTLMFDDYLAGLFGSSADAIGFLQIVPTGGRFAVSSRTYSTASGQPGTYGTAVPCFGAAAAARVGAVVRLPGIHDASLPTIQAARPGTFRTNMGIVETSGRGVSVRLTLQFTAPAGLLVSKNVFVTQEIDLAPYQLLWIPGITATLLNQERALFGDLHGVEVDVQVTGGDGAVGVFLSSVDNGSSDAILRTE